MSGYCLSFVIPWPFAAAGGTKGPLLIPSYLNAEEQLRHILGALAGCAVIFSVGVVEN